MKAFSEIAKDVYLLKVPFGPVWTGVVLLRGEENILIDSSATGNDVDAYVVPALKALGLEMADIHYLANTHSHGDHIGGHARLRQLGAFRVVSYTGSKPKIEDPVPYAIATRTKFPANSPAPQSFLQGVKVDIALEDGDVLANRLKLIHTPGHDDDCVCWLDLPTGTLITGDSLAYNRYSYDDGGDSRPNAYDCGVGMGSWAFALRDRIFTSDPQFIYGDDLTFDCESTAGIANDSDVPNTAMFGGRIRTLYPTDKAAFSAKIRSDMLVLYLQKRLDHPCLFDIAVDGVPVVRDVDTQGAKEDFAGYGLLILSLPCAADRDVTDWCQKRCLSCIETAFVI